MSYWKKQYNKAMRMKSYAWAKVFETQEELFNSTLDNLVELENIQNLTEVEFIHVEAEKMTPHLQNYIAELIVKSKQIVECPICLERIDPTDLRTGFCGHNFHKSCADEWDKTKDKPECPICRKAY